MAPSSRKRLTRRQNSDEIEDARPSQPNGRGREDVSDDDAARQHATAVKKEKVEQSERAKGKKPAQRQVAAHSDDDDARGSDDEDEEDEDDRIDVDNFPDQPLRQDQHMKLKGFADDWETIRESFEPFASVYRDVAVALADHVADNKEEIVGLEKQLKEYMDVHKEMVVNEDALRDMLQKGALGEEMTDPRRIYKRLVDDKMEDYDGKTARQKYMREDLFTTFHTDVWEVQHPNEPMPPMTELVPREPGDEDDDEDDLEIGGVTQQYTCPLTLTLLVDPMTSKVCHHSFSKIPLRDYFKAGGFKKCPASGCNKQFKFGDCEYDAKLAKKVKAHERRLARATQDNDSDAEEVVD